MYIVIGGGGQVGYYLAKGLIEQGHEVLLLEKDRKRVEHLSEELGETSVVRGDACEARTLAEVGASRANLVIAVTGDDEDNLVICQVAKARFHVPSTIARVNNPRNEGLFRRLGIDVIISPTQSILHMIEAQAFAGAPKVARQRMVYRALADELAGPVHALSVKALAPGEG